MVGLDRKCSSQNEVCVVVTILQKSSCTLFTKCKPQSLILSH